MTKARRFTSEDVIKNGCALLRSSHPSVLQHTLCTVDTLHPLVAPLPCHKALSGGMWPLSPLGRESPMKPCTHADHMSRIIQHG